MTFYSPIGMARIKILTFGRNGKKKFIGLHFAKADFHACLETQATYLAYHLESDAAYHLTPLLSPALHK